MCPKRVLCGKKRLTISVCEAIMKWNVGASCQKSLFEKLGLQATPLLYQSIQLVNKKRVRDAARKVSKKYLDRRKKLRSQRKNKTSQVSYHPGAFSVHRKPDIPVSLSNESLPNNKNVEIPLTFISVECIQNVVITVPK